MNSVLFSQEVLLLLSALNLQNRKGLSISDLLNKYILGSCFIPMDLPMGLERPYLSWAD